MIKLKKLGSNRVIFISLNIIVFGFFFYLNRRMLFFPEEIVGWGYGRPFSDLEGVRINTLNLAITNANYIYLNHIGRYFPAILTSLFLMNPSKIIFDIFNSILFLVLINVVNLSMKNKDFRNYTFIILLGLFVLIIPNFIGTVVWMLASVEYFWSGVFTVMIINLVSLKSKNKSIPLIIAFLILITSSMTEITGISIVSFFILRLLLSNNFNFVKSTKVNHHNLANQIYVLAAILGTSIVMLSPGGFIRISGEPESFNIARFAFTSSRLIYYYFMSFYIGLIIIALLLFLLYEDIDSFKASVLNSNFILFFSTAIIPMIPLVFSSGFSLRILFFPGLFIFLSIVELLDKLLNYRIKSILPIFLLGINLIVIFSLFTFWFNQIYMLQNIESRFVVRDLYYYVEVSNEFNWNDD